MRGADGGRCSHMSTSRSGCRVGTRCGTIRLIVNEALAGLSPGFHDLYARIGRPSIPPEQLLRALLLQAFYSIRSERQLMERLDFDLLFRWFVGLGVDAAVWNHSTFSKNRDRLLAGDIAAEFLAQVLDQPRVRRLLSSEHFSVDGSLVEAWASMKSFRPKDEPGEPPTGGRNDSCDFHGERRANDSHASTSRSRCPALPQGSGPGGEALLRRTCTDGKPARPCRRCRADPRLWTRRAARGTGHARPAADCGADDARRRPRLRCQRLRDGAARAPRDPAHPPRTLAAGARRSIAGPRATPATARASGSESASRKRSAGSRPRWSGQNQAARPSAGALVLYPRRCRLQPGAPATSARGERRMTRPPALAKAFRGRWRIVEMEVWPDDYLDLIEPAHIAFEGDTDGVFVFGAVKGWLDVRYGARDGAACAEFSWEGHNDADPASGRGWATIGTAGRLVGHLFIHNSDNSPFVAERE